MLHCIDICDLLLKHEENDSFLKRIVTRDEKWIVYDNVNMLCRKQSWSNRNKNAKHFESQNQKKALFDEISREFLFLFDNCTNSEMYCNQLDKLNDSIKQKRSELINRKDIVSSR